MSKILYSFGYTNKRINAYYQREDVVFLMYHRVLFEADACSVEPGMYITPETVETHLSELNNEFACLTCKESYVWFNNDSLAKNKPKCILTFDDGWCDFYQYVFPLLKKYSIPATVFLPTSFIGTGKVFWTDRIMNIFDTVQGQYSGVKERNIPFSSLITQKVFDFSCTDLKDCYPAIDYLKSYKNNVIEGVLDELETFLDIDSTEDQERVFLTWEEVMEMKESGLVEFGSHTHTHAILTTLNRSEIRYELEKSKEVLCSRGVVDPKFVPFCYPNGNYNDEIAKMVQDAGYSLAVTTRRGWNERKANIFTLNRVGLHNDISSTPSLFLARLAGLL
ncbi:MAG: polysaccharide deacetylase family protein [Desulfobacula sp.]|nr:polysaccharide deacetylase family protein [Desulfobacula sp.]